MKSSDTAPPKTAGRTPLEEITGLLLKKVAEQNIRAAMNTKRLALTEAGLFYINFCLGSPKEFPYPFDLYESMLRRCLIDLTLVSDEEYELLGDMIRNLISNTSPDQEDPALKLVETITALFGKALWSKLKIEDLFRTTIAYKKTRLFEFLLPRMNFDQRKDEDVLITLRDVSVGQLEVLLKNDAKKRSLELFNLEHLFSKILESQRPDADDLTMRLFEQYGYPQFGDGEKNHSLSGREGFIKFMLRSNQFLPKVAAVLMPANTKGCRELFANMVTTNHRQYLKNHQQALRAFYRDQYQMSDADFDELFNLKPAAAAPSTKAPSSRLVEKPSRPVSKATEPKKKTNPEQPKGRSDNEASEDLARKAIHAFREASKMLGRVNAEKPDEEIDVTMQDRFGDLTSKLKTFKDAKETVKWLTRGYTPEKIMETWPVFIIKTMKELLRNPRCNHELIEELLKTFRLEELFSIELFKPNPKPAWYSFIFADADAPPKYVTTNADFYLHLVEPDDPFCEELLERVHNNDLTQKDEQFLSFVKQLDRDYKALYENGREKWKATGREIPLFYHTLSTASHQRDIDAISNARDRRAAAVSRMRAESKLPLFTHALPTQGLSIDQLFPTVMSRLLNEVENIRAASHPPGPDQNRY